MELQQPVLRSLQEHLLAYGIAPLHLLSGRGLHLVWRVARDSRAFRRLVEAYAASPAAAFHRWFYGHQHEPPDRWAQTCD